MKDQVALARLSIALEGDSMTVETESPTKFTRTFNGRSKLALDVLNRGTSFEWRVLSKNRLTIYRKGRAESRSKALQIGNVARREEVERMGL